MGGLVASIIVTGGAGFIGYHLSRKLIEHGHTVRVIDSLNATLYPNDEKFVRLNLLQEIIGSESIFSGNISDPTWLNLFEHFDLIVNCAGIPGLDKSWDFTNDYFSSNAIDLGIMLNNLMGSSKIVPIIQLSTSSVYGGMAIGGENQNCNPISPYGVSKLAGENILAAYQNKLEFNCVILRLFSVYGSYQRPDMGIRKFIDSFLDNRPIQFSGLLEMKRSFTHVDDVTRIIVKVVSKILANKEHKSINTFNLGNRSSASLSELFHLLSEISGNKVEILFKNQRLGDQFETKSDPTKLKEYFGIEPSIELSQGLLEQFTWQRKFNAL
jgi:UDP-glucuronate 4-epimerase